MTAGREHFALDWLKDELDETLKVARQALESYSESGRDATRMRNCLTALHQVHGTLLMLELTGVTVLSDELEQLAQAMHDGVVVDLDAAQQLLMQGILQLPAHLEEIQKGLPDTRRSVLVLANDIRLARGEQGFSDAASLTPSELLLPADDEALDRFDQIDGADKARKIRGAFQQVLLSLLKGRGREDAAAVLSKVAVGLERICEGAPIVVLWRALGAYLGSVAAAGEALSGDVVKVLRRVDAEIKNLATLGREALLQPVNTVLVGVLVDAATQRGAENIELRQIADALALEAGSQTAAISGREAMQHAASALREDLAAIKDDLDMLVRSDERTADSFKQLAAPLRQVGSTLSILGFESSREILADQASALNAALETGVIDDAVLMSIAGALIQVDENLAALGRSRASTLAGTSEAAAIISDAQVAVLNEARSGLEETKHAVVDYITAQWDVSRLEAIPDLLDAVKGALAIVPLAMPALQLGQCADYVRDHLLRGEKPDWQALDHFADAISGVDYFLERLIAEGAPPGDEILVVVQRSLAALGVAGLDPDEVTSEPVLLEAVEEPAETAAESVVTEPVETAVQPVVAEPVESSAEPAVAEPVRDEPLSDEPVSDEPVSDASADDVSASPGSEFSLELLEESEPEPPALLEESEPEPPALLEESEPEPPALSLEPMDEQPVDAMADDEDPSPIVEAVEFSLEEPEFDTLAEPTAPELPAREANAGVVDVQAPPERQVPVTVEIQEPAPTIDEEFDEEIVEIFAEEVTEVLQAVDDWLPRWAAGFDNEEALTETRRAFHTLKGSGRMVGAELIGKLAWSIENMLNRIMDGTIDPHDQVVSLIREAGSLIPSLTEAFRARQPVQGESVAAIVERADVLSSGGRIEELGAPVEIPDDAQVETETEAEAQQMPAGEASQEPDLDEPDQHEPEAVILESPVEAAPAEMPHSATPDAADELDTRPEEESETLAGSAAKDPEVMALFEEEANRHLEILESRLNSEDDIAELELDETVMRALHTLRGSAAMAGIAAVAGVATPLYEVATAFRNTMQPITPDLFDFLQQGVFALRRCLDALSHGQEPDEDQALFESEARRILAELGTDDASGVASLMQLEGTPVLLGAGDQLIHWRERGAPSDGLVDVVAALHEVRNECQSRRMDGVADLCDGLIESYEIFEAAPLSAAAFESLDEGHELLLEVFDRIAADQEPPDMALVVGKLAAARLEEPEAASAPADADAERNSAELLTFPSVDTQVPELELQAPLDETQADEALSDQAEPAAEQQNVARRARTLPDDVDEEILEIFFEEADELLESIDHGVHEWFDARDNRVYLENLLRALHTLKGGARLAGLMELGDQTHALESYLVAVQNDETDPGDEFFSDLQRRHDELAMTVSLLKAAAHGEEVDPESMPLEMDGAVESPVLDDDPEEADAEPEVAAAQAPEVVAPADEPIAPAGPARTQTAEVVPLAPEAETATDAKPQVQTAARPNEPREMVRVAATLLEELVNLAGENSIIRSRIEQVINDFSGSLEEMETTIERVREQLRRLEIETEAQVLFRHTRGDGPVYDEFDPLEMDRYSQLQQVSKSLSETASDMLDLKETLANKARESETLLIQQARVNTELQEGLMRTRMVPFSRLLPRLRRIVRQVARDLGKQVEFHAYNAEGELDRNVLERMVPALEHMLRNSVDHGIEMPKLRSNFGKPEMGRIDLRLSREAGDVVIEITDDGAGIDIETVRAKAIERGLMSADAWMADDDILQFVLAPGFTTAKAVTQISGRGVGMDVVHSAVKELGGAIDIMSMPGKGTRFTVRLPFTVSVSRALMVSVGEDTYAVPLNNIEGIVRVSTRELAELSDPKGMGFEYAGVPYKVRYLGTYIGREYAPRPDQTSVPMVLIRSGDQALAVHVDSVQGSREIVVKSLGPQFAGVGGISGATILGDGSVVVILDLITLIRAHSGTSAQVRSERPQYARDPARPTCVMVVDDSVTVRKVTSRLLERQGMDVVVAKDGVEAIALLQERRPDIILLDIEMPRMDGFEVARQVRHDQGLAELPIVMISSRTGSKHQERAAELGVNRFLGKPFQESDLLATIDELVDI
jgi:chemosensory pili system protein ChpA (sensor histidine kinase/response regulator)